MQSSRFMGVWQPLVETSPVSEGEIDAGVICLVIFSFLLIIE